ncbi:FKBP-type peptidyl-prolyl cis-trans isomerase [Epilithonimonas mollis]|uniref:Peptidyl-prolyl cis-trans isomerase n=1 Tax=Epilithonimonas mollis TaxID=216903 RepID=A0A1M6U025_9FLAO|nr:FKBP-type peptidyl-prolyl cis-trans isomerase [Epilithonimonas mollis]SHK62605.1 protein involved in gliding motility GldI [Epilithonimonas mollis]
MNKLFYITFLALVVSCAKQTPVQPEGQFLSESEMEDSKNRSKDLNNLERAQIEDWINAQNIKYYPMGMNYWINVENLEKRPRKNNGERISYQYHIYDFDRTRLYDVPVENINVEFGHFKELDAVEDAVRYLKKGEEAELLIPSVLAFGTYGDGKKISNDMPLIIKVKVL